MRFYGLFLFLLGLLTMGATHQSPLPSGLSQVAPEGYYILENTAVKTNKKDLKCPMPGKFQWVEVEKGRWSYQLHKNDFVALTLSKVNQGYAADVGNPKNKLMDGLHSYFENTLSKAKKRLSEKQYSYVAGSGKKKVEVLTEKKLLRTGAQKIVYSLATKERTNGKVTSSHFINCPYRKVSKNEI